MSEDLPPNAWLRLTLLGLAILMPLLAAAALVFFAASTVIVGSSDRALLWAEGDRSQIHALSKRVSDSDWFGNGRTRSPGAENPLPSSCGAAAQEFSFGGLRAEQAQAARTILESYASEVGARVCLSNTFIINEHPDPVASTSGEKLASAMLQSALIPCGFVILVYWAFARQLRLQPNAGGQLLRVQVGAGAMAALVGALTLAGFAVLLRFAGGMAQEPSVGSVADLGPYLIVAILISESLLEELSFRAWLIPIAERAIGTLGAATLSTLLFALVHLPYGWGESGSALIVGAVLAATYVRTRSLLACVVANALMAAASLMIA